MSMKLGNFLDPETKGEDSIHQHYRFDSEVARKMEDYEHNKESKDSPLESKKIESEKKKWWESLFFWR